MLEHADRHDAVEALFDIAIILQTELDPVRQSFLLRARARKRKLLLRERDAGDLRAAHLAKVEPEAAPARADVEHARSRLDQELRSQMAFLGELGVVERLVGLLEIGAAVLAVGIEKEGVELLSRS